MRNVKAHMTATDMLIVRRYERCRTLPCWDVDDIACWRNQYADTARFSMSADINPTSRAWLYLWVLNRITSRINWSLAAATIWNAETVIMTSIRPTDNSLTLSQSVTATNVDVSSVSWNNVYTRIRTKCIPTITKLWLQEMNNFRKEIASHSREFRNLTMEWERS